MNPRSLSFTCCVLLFAVTCGILSASRLHAGSWYTENVSPGSDIIMMDVRWPWVNSGVYSANWNITTHDADDKKSQSYFYGGVSNGVRPLKDGRPDLDPVKQDAWRGGGPWSFWGGSSSGESPVCVEGAAWSYADYIASGHEGSSCGIGGSFPWVRRNVWYTQVARIWHEEGDPYSYIARWMKDSSKGEWHLLGVVRLPFQANAFTTGNRGFIEHFSGGALPISALDRRLGYHRKDGEWKSSNTVTLTGADGWAAAIRPEEDHEYLQMEVTPGKVLKPVMLTEAALLTEHRAYEMAVKQPAGPALEKPFISEASAFSDGSMISVHWDVSQKSSPQLGWKVEIYDNPNCTGKPIAVHEGRMPQTRAILISANTQTPGVLIRIIDAFDQISDAFQVAPKNAGKPSSAITVADVRSGLSYAYFTRDEKRKIPLMFKTDPGAAGRDDESHIWVSTAEIPTGKRISGGTCNGLDISFAGNRKAGIAFTYDGLIQVPATGLYTFHVLASDAYVMKIDGSPVVTWDTLHGTMVRSGSVYLEKGFHAFNFDYCVDHSPYLKLEWEGPGIARSEIPDAAYFHHPSPGEPIASISTTGNSIKVSVDPQGSTVTAVSLFHGRLCLDSTKGTTLDYTGPLFSGKNSLFARVSYGKDNTVDTPFITIKGPETKLPNGWELKSLTDEKAPKGIREASPGIITGIGEGDHVVAHKTDGDFTLTCRIDSFTSAPKFPVSKKAWVGLMVEGKHFGLYQTASAGVHTGPDFNDWASTGLGAAKLPDVPWLRIVRQGQTWTAWTSPDGKNWTLGGKHVIPMKKNPWAGLLFRDTTLGAANWFRASVSNLTFLPGVAKDSQVPSTTAAKGTSNLRHTGVISSYSDPKILVLRGPEIGVMRSVDSGCTWKPANGNLAGSANAVRSVAIDPSNPQVMYRAAGIATKKGFEGGLWKTTDGGSTWEKLDFPGDFDGRGPSAICGEVVEIAYDHPEIVFAGTETSGLFVSRDSGKTWSRILAAGERITSVRMHLPFGSGDPTAFVVTCPDKFLPLLGRGEPELKTTATTSRSYSVIIGRDGKINTKQHESRDDVGYLSGMVHRLSRHFGTTDGFEVTYMHGQRTALAIYEGSESFRPVTGVVGWPMPGNSVKVRFGALDTEHPGMFSDNIRNGRLWAAVPAKPASATPAGGAISLATVSGSPGQNWVLTIDGLYLLSAPGMLEQIRIP